MAISLTSGLKILAGISVIMSLLMLLGTSWIFGTQMVKLEKKLNDSHVPDFNSELWKKPEEKHFQQVLKDLKHVWAKNQPILTTCCSIAIVAGLTQLVSSFFVVFSDSKKIQQRARYWLTIHFMVFITLIVCLLTVYLMKTNEGLSMKRWFEILKDFEESLNKLNKDKPVDYSELLSYLKCGQWLYYVSTVPNLIASISLLCGGVFVMHRYRDYESYE